MLDEVVRTPIRALDRHNQTCQLGWR